MKESHPPSGASRDPDTHRAPGVPAPRSLPVQRIPPTNDYIRRHGPKPGPVAAIGPAAAASIDVGAATPGAAPTPAADPAPFVHLHVHSNFSFLDGGSRIEELVARAAALGQPALALTDHDGLYGAIRFAKTCAKHKIKPLFGAEIRVESLLHAERAMK